MNASTSNRKHRISLAVNYFRTWHGKKKEMNNLTGSNQAYLKGEAGLKHVLVTSVILGLQQSSLS